MIIPQRVLLEIATRFVVNVPPEDRDSFERLMAHCQEAYYYYVDVLVPATADTTSPLPGMHLFEFTRQLLSLCTSVSLETINAGIDSYIRYTLQISVCGVMLFDVTKTHVLLVTARQGSRWVFPKGKISINESEFDCAVREAYEEVGIDVSAYLEPEPLVRRARNSGMSKTTLKEPPMTFFVGVTPYTTDSSSSFTPRCHGEIYDAQWIPLGDMKAEYERLLHVGPGVIDDAVNTLSWAATFYPDIVRYTKMDYDAPKRIPDKYKNVTPRYGSGSKARMGSTGRTGTPLK